MLVRFCFKHGRERVLRFTGLDPFREHRSWVCPVCAAERLDRDLRKLHRG